MWVFPPCYAAFVMTTLYAITGGGGGGGGGWVVGRVLGGTGQLMDIIYAHMADMLTTSRPPARADLDLDVNIMSLDWVGGGSH